MASLDRVPGPRSPWEGWVGRVVGLVAIGIVVAVVKPWGDGAPRPAWSSRPAATQAPIADAASPPTYDPTAYDPAPPPAAWALLTPEGSVALPFLGRGGGPSGDGTGVSVDPVVSGPVVVIGRDAPVLSIALAHPADAGILTARLWSLADRSDPVRLELRTMAPPWSVPHALVLARPGDGRQAVTPWTPGLYRLDLLLAPERVARSVMLHVGSGGGLATGPGRDAVQPDVTSAPRDDAISLAPDDRPPDAGLDGVLAFLPDGVTFWTSGSILTGWNRRPSPAGCALVDIWAADPRAPCWAVPLGAIGALGVNLGSRSVARIDLVRLDPLPGPFETTSRTDVRGDAGLALVEAPGGELPDGVYRLDAHLTGGTTMAWFVEVGPVGRAVARVHEASTSR